MLLDSSHAFLSNFLRKSQHQRAIAVVLFGILGENKETKQIIRLFDVFHTYLSIVRPWHRLFRSFHSLTDYVERVGINFTPTYLIAIIINDDCCVIHQQTNTTPTEYK